MAQQATFQPQSSVSKENNFSYSPNYEDPNFAKSRKAILIQEEDEMYSSSEVVEESLSLEEMGKRFYKKSIEKI